VLAVWQSFPLVQGFAPSAVSRELLVEVVGTVYGEWPCDRTCLETLSRRLQQTKNPIAALCGKALLGQAKPSMRLDEMPWLEILSSNLPVWRLFWSRRVGADSGERLDEVAHSLLAIYERHLLPRMRSAVEKKKGWKTGPAAPFRSLIRHFRELTDEIMIAEWFLSVAGALRLGKMMHSLSSPEGPSVDIVYRASDWFLVQGQKLLTNRTGNIPEWLLQLLAYNEEVRIEGFGLWPQLLPEDATGAFAGANDGIVARVVAETMPKARIFAFEADPYIYRKFEKNIEYWKPDPKLFIPQFAALHKEHGLTIDIHTRDGMGAQSTIFATNDRFKEEWPWVEFGSTAKVKAVALEPHLRERGVNRLDFIFLDVECAELWALQGARSLLSNITLLHLEVTNDAVCDGGPLWSDFERWLNRRGFRTIVVPQKPWAIRMDITAVRWPLPKRPS